MWHVSSRSGVATLRTTIHLLLTYLLTPRKRKKTELLLLLHVMLLVNYIWNVNYEHPFLSFFISIIFSMSVKNKQEDGVEIPRGYTSLVTVSSRCFSDYTVHRSVQLCDRL